jgi:hypothetical protein
LRQFIDEIGLLLWREHQVSVTFALGRECREDPSVNSEIRRTHMGAFLCTFQAQSDPAKIGGIHPNIIQRDS